MKRLLIAAGAALLCFAANAKEAQVISVVCNGTNLLKIENSVDPSRNVTHTSPVTKTYSFKFEKNPRKDGAMEWSMQTDGAGWDYQQELFARADDPAEATYRLEITVLDHSIFVRSEGHRTSFTDRSGFRHPGATATRNMKINRLSGDWSLETVNDYSSGSSLANYTTGKCEAAKPKF